MVPLLHPARPIHLLGIGDIETIDACVPLGIDTFDSSYPTKAGRHGTLFTRFGFQYIPHLIIIITINYNANL